MVCKKLVPENIWPVVDGFLGLIFFSFLSCKLNSYLRHISTFFFFFFLGKDAKTSSNSAPKSPCSVPLQVYTAACVYKVQDHTFLSCDISSVLITFCVVAEVLGFFKFSLEEDFVAFLLGRNGCWYRV